MAWVAMDRAVRAVERDGCPGCLERWRSARDAIHEQVCRQGYDPQRNTFVQYYGGQALDASLLMVPLMGFLPPDDDRVRATVLAIADELTEDGLVLRYKVDTTDTGFEGKEGTAPGA